MRFRASVQGSLDEHLEVFHRLSGLAPAIDQAGELIAAALARGNKLMLCGNGGCLKRADLP